MFPKETIFILVKERGKTSLKKKFKASAWLRDKRKAVIHTSLGAGNVTLIGCCTGPGNKTSTIQHDSGLPNVTTVDNMSQDPSFSVAVFHSVIRSQTHC